MPDKFVCQQPCFWMQNGICIRNPCPYGRLRIIKDKKNDTQEAEKNDEDIYK